MKLRPSLGCQTHRNQTSSQFQSPQQGGFRKTKKMSGHTLMRRTECSWSKVGRSSPSMVNKTQNKKKTETVNAYCLNGEKNKLEQEGAGMIPIRTQQNTLSPLSPRFKLFFKKKSANYNLKSKQRVLSPQSKWKKFLQNQKNKNQEQLESLVSTIETKPENIRTKNLQANIEQQTEKIAIKEIKDPFKSLPSLKNKKNHENLEASKKVLKPIKRKNKARKQKISYLPLNSKIPSKSMVSSIQGTASKIQLHFEILDDVGKYSKKLLSSYQDPVQWQQLALQTFKFYYCSRVRAALSLKGLTNQNPFILSICSIKSSELSCFRQSKESQKIINSVEVGNKAILMSLKNFHQKIYQTPLSNQFDINSLIFQIYNGIKIEINLLKELVIKGSKTAKKRLLQAYKCWFLVSELQGKFILSYEESLDDDNFNYWSYFHKASKLFYELF